MPWRSFPVDQREALILVGAEGFSYEDAASISGCAVGTVKSRVNRARVKLAELMAPPEDGAAAAPTDERAQSGAEEAGTCPDRLVHVSEVPSQEKHAESWKPAALCAAGLLRSGGRRLARRGDAPCSRRTGLG